MYFSRIILIFVLALVTVMLPSRAFTEEIRGQERAVFVDLDAPIEYGAGTVSLGMGSEWGIRRSQFATGIYATLGAPLARALLFRPFGELYWTTSYVFHGSWLLGTQVGVGMRYDGSSVDAYFAQWVYFTTLRPLGPHLSIYMMESPDFAGHENHGEVYFRFRAGLKIDLPRHPDIFAVPAVQIAWVDILHEPRNPGGGVALTLFKLF